MESHLTPDSLRAAARLIDLPITDDEIEPVLAQLKVLLDAATGVSKLVVDTDDPDVRFDPRWDNA